MSEQNEQDETTEPDAADAPGTDELAETQEVEEAAEEAETAAGEHGEASDDETDAGEGQTESGERQPSAKDQRDQQKMVEKMFDAADRETKRHTTRVAEIAGDAAPDLLMCPMCAPDEGQPSFPGWLLPVKFSHEKIANVRTAIGLAPKIDYREDPHSKACPTCGGLRSVVPAGMDAAALTLPCADCKAQGWVPVGTVRGGTVENGSNLQNVTLKLADAPTLEPDSPEVAALKAQGYTVIAPYRAEA